MRGLLPVSLVAAGLAGSAFAHIHDSDAPMRRRKSLGFGPIHPQAVFRSSPYQIQTNGFLPFSAASDPMEVARHFVEDQLAGRLTRDNTFIIRKDSYTDKNTGVTHVYVRQVVNGIEVADGDMNINVKDGMVLSYGDSVRQFDPMLCINWCLIMLCSFIMALRLFPTLMITTLNILMQPSALSWRARF
jgi:extracellular elastinolytic metalloproteinase